MACDVIKEKIENGAKLIDVRTAREYYGGRLPSAQNIPLEQIPEFLKDFDKDAELLLYCRSGARSGHATAFLQSLGYKAQNIGGINQFLGCIVY